MVRYILFFLLGFVLCRIFRLMLGSRGRPGDSVHPYGAVHKPPKEPAAQPRTFTDVTDAKFEEVPPEKNKN